MGLVLSLAVVLTLGACTDDPPDPPTRPSYADPTVEAASAPDTYGPLVADVADQVAAAAGTTAGRGGPETLWRDTELDRCMYSSARYELAAVLGEDVDWDEVREIVTAAVEAHGFEVTEQLEIPGGFNGFDAVAEDGGRLEVRSKLGRPSTIDLEAPVLGECPASGSETLAP